LLELSLGEDDEDEESPIVSAAVDGVSAAVVGVSAAVVGVLAAVVGISAAVVGVSVSLTSIPVTTAGSSYSNSVIIALKKNVVPVAKSTRTSSSKC
jgi:hypothetical protein